MMMPDTQMFQSREDVESFLQDYMLACQVPTWKNSIFRAILFSKYFFLKSGFRDHPHHPPKKTKSKPKPFFLGLSLLLFAVFMGLLLYPIKLVLMLVRILTRRPK